MNAREAKLTYIAGLIVFSFIFLELRANHAIVLFNLAMASSLAFFLSFCDADRLITGPIFKVNKASYKAAMIIIAVVISLLAFWYRLYALLGLAMVFFAAGLYAYPKWMPGDIDGKRSIFFEKPETNPEKIRRNYIQYFIILGLLLAYVLWSKSTG